MFFPQPFVSVFQSIDKQLIDSAAHFPCLSGMTMLFIDFEPLKKDRLVSLNSPEIDKFSAHQRLQLHTETADLTEKMDNFATQLLDFSPCFKNLSVQIAAYLNSNLDVNTPKIRWDIRIKDYRTGYKKFEDAFASFILFLTNTQDLRPSETLYFVEDPERGIIQTLHAFNESEALRLYSALIRDICGGIVHDTVRAHKNDPKQSPKRL